MVIARADITVTVVVDISATVWFYLLQSSTLSPPSKPTEDEPARWTEVEPTYTAGSTNSLYTTVKTIFCDGTFSYSDVSLSSSYEAAKEAYNKAVAAEQGLAELGEETQAGMEQITQEQIEYTNLMTENSQETTRTMLEDYTKVSDFENYQEQVSTSISHTSDQIEMNFTTVSNRITEENGEFTKQFEKIEKYIRFVDGNIILGEEGNQLTLKISNDRISFLEGLNEVAYMSNNKLCITDGETVNSFKIGNYAFLPRSNGSVDFTKVG